MRLLFVHQNFPGQYRHLVKHCAGLPGYDIACIGEAANFGRWEGAKGVRLYGTATPQGGNPATHPYLRDVEGHIRRGQAVTRTALEIRKEGFSPDLICAHTGWGEALYLKDVFPNAKVLAFCEYYYNADHSDVDFDKITPVSMDTRLFTRTRNATQLLSMMVSDHGVSPTHWQRAQYPPALAERISVIHDGIDTDIVRPDPQARCTFGDKGLSLRSGDEIITFVSRNLEPYRGFHILCQALPLIQQLRPQAHIIIVGADDLGYGPRPPEGTTHRELHMSAVRDKLDLSKIHFLGRVPYNHLIALFQISAAHVYLTYPFVLSWSMLEAMAAECLVIGSKTPPVEEVIEHEKNGLLVDFFDPEHLAHTVDRALRDPEEMRPLRKAARKTIMEKYDLHSHCLPAQMRLMHAVAQGRMPASCPAPREDYGI